jgi:hypothetical protein
MNLWELADLRTPWCIHVACTLRLAEHIEAGHTHIADLAQAAQADPFVLHSVLDLLVEKGIFEQPERGRFALNDAAKGLLNPALRLGLDLNGFGGRMAHAWSTMLPYVQTGLPAYKQIFGRTFWDDLDANPAIAADFDNLIGPGGHGPPNPHFPVTTGWDAIRTVVDIGGGTGSMLAEILRIHPHIQGALVELPRTAARAAKLDRLTAIGQSFFDPLPPGADLYLLRGVLNNWPDAEAQAILTRCAEAACPSSRLVVLKSVHPANQPHPISIDTILTGGKPRTLPEFTLLAQASGLRVIAAAQHDPYFVVECAPA